MPNSIVARDSALDAACDDTIHDRSIVTDTGWKILLGRALDVFPFVTGDAFGLATEFQEYRQVKASGVTHIRENESPLIESHTHLARVIGRGRPHEDRRGRKCRHWRS
ncbi:MIT C-terminal domain-containing protein [Cryobacterium sp. HLT2-28]|uniref:MIT C-terminal domain-containing protein n=1 Tax=Cryobacterium sp. HLT2-28 TaxID=1259146 RepID=UPI00106BF78A|nr:MIT C-terminal domain-containing protein [Cryobacterium sp. HLT2-28]TFB93138.1 hypothetical protein E3O48_10840 [Cryobacterium sp. HLT2-28]